MSDLEAVLQREAEIADAEPTEEDYPFARPRPAREPSQVYSIRIPVGELEELRKLAADRGVAASALLREWILERLRLEQRLPLPPPLNVLREHIVHDVLEEIPAAVARSVRTATNIDFWKALIALIASEPVDTGAARALGNLLQRAQDSETLPNVTDLLGALRKSIQAAGTSSEEPAEVSG